MSGKKLTLTVTLVLMWGLIAWSGCFPAPKKTGKTKVFERVSLRPVPYQVFLHNAFMNEVTDKVIKPALNANALKANESVLVILEKDRFAKTPRDRMGIPLFSRL